MNKVRGGTIRLRSGAYFDLAHPTTVDIRDIAHGLSHICRFTGHVRCFYSVAEHSVHASRIVPSEFAFEALMHDAAEALIGDVAKPLKQLLPDYQRIEKAVERAVLGGFGLSEKMSPAVKRADLAMLRAEQTQAMDSKARWSSLDGVPPANVTLQFWSPEVARREFIARFVELNGVVT